MIVELTILPIALMCVTLRLWIRVKWLHMSWWDDYLMVVAAVRFRAKFHSDIRLTWDRFGHAGQRQSLF